MRILLASKKMAWLAYPHWQALDNSAISVCIMVPNIWNHYAYANRSVAANSNAGYTSVRDMAGYVAESSEPSVMVGSCAPTSTLRSVCSVQMLGLETLIVCLLDSSKTTYAMDYLFTI